LAFEHLERYGDRQRELMNIACDIVVNNILVTNNFRLPYGVLIPHNNEIDLSALGLKSIENIEEEHFQALLG